ncbi:MAG: YfcE family phosphodiesterase [Candidatus Hodarchaeota archaeon]
MVRILCIGDSHVPIRAKELPMQIYDKINEITESELFDFTFFTGDLINFPELLDFLNIKTKRSLFKVIGNMDYYYGNRDLPNYQKLDISFENNNKIILGLTHGAQVRPRGDHDQLENLALKRGYTILVSGHTHKEEVFLTSGGILLINPGSVTGAWSFIASGIPSFIEIYVDNRDKNILIKLFQFDKKIRQVNTSEFYFILKKNRIYKKY